jgi:tetratricopeptide (TPR) repeat protein
MRLLISLLLYTMLLCSIRSIAGFKASVFSRINAYTRRRNNLQQNFLFVIPKNMLSIIPANDAEAFSDTTAREQPTKKGKAQQLPHRNEDTMKLYKHAKNRDYQSAMEVYEFVKQQSNRRFQRSELFALMSLCCKKEHLPQLHELVLQLSSSFGKDAKTMETSHLAYIRCYADAGDFKTAFVYLEELIQSDIDLRQRVFQPLIEALSAQDDIEQLLGVFWYMKEKNFGIRNDQLSALLMSLSKPGIQETLRREPHLLESFHKVLADAAQELLGLPTSALKQIVASVNHISIDEVVDQGVLVESIVDISDRIISTENFSQSGCVIALNASFEKDSSPSGGEDHTGSSSHTTGTAAAPATVKSTLASFGADKYAGASEASDVELVLPAYGASQGGLLDDEDSNRGITGSGGGGSSYVATSAVRGLSSSGGDDETICNEFEEAIGDVGEAEAEGEVQMIGNVAPPSNPSYRTLRTAVAVASATAAAVRLVPEIYMARTERMKMMNPIARLSDETLLKSAYSIISAPLELDHLREDAKVDSTKAKTTTTIAQELGNRLLSKIKYTSSTGGSSSSSISSSSRSCTVVPEELGEPIEQNDEFLWKLLRRQPKRDVHPQQLARIVDISPRSCRCPNCDGVIMPLTLTEEDKTTVRHSLEEIAYWKDPRQAQNLEV